MNKRIMLIVAGALISVLVILVSAAALTRGTDADAVAIMNGDVQEVEAVVTAQGGYPTIEVTKGIPVRINFKVNLANDLTGCNSKIVIPEYGIEKELQVGDNIVEFTPTDSGTIDYACWMGMIESEINVTR